MSRRYIIQESLQKYSEESKWTWCWALCIMAALEHELFFHNT